MKWKTLRSPNDITPDMMKFGYVLVANSRGFIMGLFSGYNADHDAWYINDCLFDGEDLPAFYLEIPEIIVDDDD